LAGASAAAIGAAPTAMVNEAPSKTRKQRSTHVEGKWMAMFKKLLLAAMVLAAGLWAWGVDPVKLKDRLVEAQDRQAASISGRDALEQSDWGER